MSDFDQKLEELRRGTEGLKAPEGFDAALNAKLIAAAALPPAVAGAGLAWGLKLLIGVVAFTAAGGAVWLATGDPRELRPSSTATVAGVPPPAPATPRAPMIPQLGRRDGPSAGPPPEVANPGQPGTPAELIKPEGTVSATQPGSDAGAGGGTLTISSESIAVVARGTATMCGRQVDRVELVSLGKALDGVHKWAGKSDRMLSIPVEAKSVTLGRKNPAEILVVGRLVVDGGPGLRAVSSEVQMVDDWFIATGLRGDRIEVVVNEYRPIALDLSKLSSGAHFVGEVHLQWIGKRPADERTLHVTVDGEQAGMAMIRLFPMWCDRKGQWQAGFVHTEDLPASGAIYTHMSATKYRVAAYAPDAVPAWSDVLLYAAPEVSQTLTLIRERPVRVELASGMTEVQLSKPWHPAPGIHVEFTPGRETGSLCLDFGADIRGVVVNEPVATAQPVSVDELMRHGDRCIVYDKTMVWQSQTTKSWVAAKFHR